MTLVPPVPADLPIAESAPADADQAGDRSRAGRSPGDLGGHQIFLCPGPESARVAREFTADTLRGWNLDAILDEAMIIASELVTNAIRHGVAVAGDGLPARPVEISWQRRDDQVICTVKDGSASPPVLAPADLTADSGRGLQIVQGLAEAWGWMRLGGTQKAVWAALNFVAGSLSP